MHHGCNRTGPYSPEAVQTLARFPLVVVEKWQSLGVAGDEEEHIINALRAVKEASPSTTTIFYYNSVCDFQQCE